MRRGNPDSAFDGRPQIAIVNTASDLAPCNTHLDEIAQSVKNGIWEAGGVPLNLPMISLGETQVRPTAMLWRNMAAMATEEMMRANPIDGAVLLGGCDKTIPALLMGASSVDLPSIVVPGGPMLTGTFRGSPLGCGTDVWRMSEEVRAGLLSKAKFLDSESAMIRSRGHCNTMGTASTMGIMAEALGMTLPGVAGIPAPDSRLLQAAHNSGRRIVEMVTSDLKPSDVMTKASFENAILALAAIGGSTNAVVHLLAIAGRLGVNLTLDDFDRIGSRIPLLVNLQPSGKYLMEDFYYAGGMTALIKTLSDHLHLTAMTVNGLALGENVASAQVYNPDVIRPLDRPLYAEGALAVLRGNLAPAGAVIKPSACATHLRQHTDPAMVFDSYPEMKAAVEDDHLDITAEHVMVLRNAGPQGGPGMPEWGQLPIPRKLLAQGVRDMVRLSDARMSGTSYGACILHVSPEAFIGGPLALVQNGDMIELNVPERKLQLLISDEELARRLALWEKPAPAMNSGYWKLYIDHVLQADEGADMDFLVGQRGSAVPKDNH